MAEGDSVVVTGDPGETGTEPSTSWIPDTHKDNPALARYQTKTLGEYIDASLDLETQLGRTIQHPGKDASPEERVKFYQGIPGQPKTAAEYDVQPLSVPEHARSIFDNTALLDMLHASGAPSHVADAVVRHIEQRETTHFEGIRDEDQRITQEAREVLGRTWGASNVDHNLLVGKEGLGREYGALEWLGGLVTTNSEGKQQLVSNSPQFAMMAYDLARSKGHDQYVLGGAGLPATTDQAIADMDAARANLRTGKITEAEFDRTQARLAPFVYSTPNDDIDIQVGGRLTAQDFPLENE